MVEIWIDGDRVEAQEGQTVMQAARASGHQIPGFCWHPALSVPGNCRVCMVEVDGDGTAAGWLDIACNMPVARGMRIHTDSERVRSRRRELLQLVTLNHPVDCGICDKAGECTLQDYHVRYNGAPSVSRDAKVQASKHHVLSERIVIDNERCILCSRCVRFTHEVSKSHGLAIVNRADQSLVRASEDGAFEGDAYSDNVIDICPVGALLSRPHLHRMRVWTLEATPSVCPGCERGCAIDVWHRKGEWRFLRLDPRLNARIERVTPRDNPEVNGPWICNKGRDLAALFERPRATEALVDGARVAPELALGRARELLAEARHPVALVSSWASNEELAAFQAALGARVAAFVRTDRAPEPGELLEDGLLVRPDKNPNRRGATALYPPLPDDARAAFPAACDLVIAWGEACDLAALPPAAHVIRLDAWADPGHARADVFLPISVQTERSGHYTNFAGVASRFEPCFEKPPGVLHAEALFAALALPVAVALP
jgi:NADH-quinone oxidoreductase subunit G